MNEKENKLHLALSFTSRYELEKCLFDDLLSKYAKKVILKLWCKAYESALLDHIDTFTLLYCCSKDEIISIVSDEKDKFYKKFLVDFKIDV